MNQRLKEKLTFPLCVKCAEDGCEKYTQDEDERVINGTSIALEIRLAVEIEYKNFKISED